MTRFIYLDEAGISGKQEPYITVAGILVHGDRQLDKVYDELPAISAKHVPERYKEQGLVLHVGDLYGGNAKFDESRDPYWTREHRYEILAELAKIPTKTKLKR